MDPISAASLEGDSVRGDTRREKNNINSPQGSEVSVCKTPPRQTETLFQMAQCVSARVRLKGRQHENKPSGPCDTYPWISSPFRSFWAGRIRTRGSLRSISGPARLPEGLPVELSWSWWPCLVALKAAKTKTTLFGCGGSHTKLTPSYTCEAAISWHYRRVVCARYGCEHT